MRLSTCITAASDTRTLISAAATLFIAAVCGCSATGPSTGSLTVTIAAPGGVTPAVTVSGPNAYSQQLAVTTTLTGLAPGSYSVVPAPATIAGAIVSTYYNANVSGSPAIVSAGGQASASATYDQGGTGGLWVANLNSSRIVQFSAAQLAGTTSAAAAIAINTGFVDNFGVALDECFDLWVSTSGQNAVQEYSQYQLTAVGSPTPIDALTPVSGAAGLAFDKFGDLWVANNESSTLSVYDPVDSYDYPCTDFGTLYGIEPAPNTLLSPTGIAFD